MATSKKDMSDQEWRLLEDIGQMFKDLRVESGMTQQQAARALGVSQGRVPVLEHGQADVMITTLNRWASLYGLGVQISLVPIEDEFDEALREAAEELADECDCPAHSYFGRECTCCCVHSEEVKHDRNLAQAG